MTTSKRVREGWRRNLEWVVKKGEVRIIEPVLGPKKASTGDDADGCVKLIRLVTTWKAMRWRSDEAQVRSSSFSQWVEGEDPQSSNTKQLLSEQIASRGQRGPGEEKYSQKDL